MILNVNQRTAGLLATRLTFIPPKGSCDCHVHVFESDIFPFAEARVGGKLSAEESSEHLKKMAAKISSFGWHLQIYTNLHEIAALSETLTQLPVPVPVAIDRPGKPSSRYLQHRRS